MSRKKLIQDTLTGYLAITNVLAVGVGIKSGRDSFMKSKYYQGKYRKEGIVYTNIDVMRDTVSGFLTGYGRGLLWPIYSAHHPY